MGFKTLTCSVALLICLYATPVRAAVSVTEVAWMGTSVSSNDEWIELYNDSEDAVDFSLYKIAWRDIVIQLNGSIPGKSYFLLERTDDGSVPDIAADQVYVGSLGNAGEHLQILNNGSVEWEYDASAGWPAGDNATKETMQFNGVDWVTALASPRAENQSGVSGSGSDQLGDISEAGSSVLYNPPQVYKEPEFELTVEGVSYAPVGSPVILKAKGIPEGERFEYSWSMGDGSVDRSNSVVHHYGFSGVYAPTIRAIRGSAEYVEAVRLVVFDADLSFGVIDQSRVEIKNTSSYPVDLYNWRLVSGRSSFVFPRDTVLLVGVGVSFPSYITQISDFTEGLSLVRPDGQVVLGYRLEETGIIAPSPVASTTESDIVVVLDDLSSIAQDLWFQSLTLGVELDDEVVAPQDENLGLVFFDEPSLGVDFVDSVATTNREHVFEVSRSNKVGFADRMSAWIGRLFDP